jgi:hypothetical protein
MTHAEAAAKLHRAADYLLENYYEATNTPERAEEAMEIGSAIGLLFALAQRLDGKPLPPSGWARLCELLERRRAN